MTEYVLSIDPGVSTGIALIGYKADEAPFLVDAWQFTGAVLGLKGWIEDHYRASHCDYERMVDHPARLRNVDGRRYTDLLLSDDVEDVYDEVEEEYVDRVVRPQNVTVIAEKFTARATSGFGYTTESLEPLRGEGALIALGLMPDYTPKGKRWRAPALQYLVGGKDLADKKRRQHAFLKDIGFYRTNKDFPDSPSKDGADDARSAMAHGLAYLAREVKHKPTFDLITEWSER